MMACKMRRMAHMNDAFKRILALARRTGDRLIVTDPDGLEAFALLSLDQYEELLGGPKDEPGLPPPPPDLPPPAPAIVDVPTLEFHDPEPPVDVPEPPSIPITPVPPPVSVPVLEAQPVEKPPVSQALPSISGEEEDFGEEQFYLEPVE